MYPNFLINRIHVKSRDILTQSGTVILTYFGRLEVVFSVDDSQNNLLNGRSDCSRGEWPAIAAEKYKKKNLLGESGFG